MPKKPKKAALKKGKKARAPRRKKAEVATKGLSIDQVASAPAGADELRAAIVADGAMMNVVQASRVAKPVLQQRRIRHPEFDQVHAVMQIAEHEQRPKQQRTEKQHLAGIRQPERMNYRKTKQQDNSRGNHPLQSDVPQRKAIGRRVGIFVGT